MGLKSTEVDFRLNSRFSRYVTPLRIILTGADIITPVPAICTGERSADNPDKSLVACDEDFFIDVSAVTTNDV